MFKGFKEFIMRGNLVELAVAFVIGGALATLVTSFVGFIMSIVSKIFDGPPNFDDVAPWGILIGPVITATITFLVLAAVVYFIVVAPYEKLQERRSRGEETSPPSEEVTLLTEIRDLLATRSSG